MERREFVKNAALSAAALAAGAGRHGSPASAEEPPAPKNPPELKKGMVQGMLGSLPKEMSLLDRFKLARDCGFDGVEGHTMSDPRTVDETRAAAEKSGLLVHSIMNSDHWSYPLSSEDPQVVKKCVEGIETSLRNAKALGATTVLLVPAVVNPKTRYIDAYQRSQKEIKALLPLAQELGVTIAVEEVWNKFLLSPMEFARYVDEIGHPNLKAYFDVGNVLIWGYPQDWIRTLGQRIAKVHVKGYDLRRSAWVGLREGSIDWPEVRRAFAEVGYHGWLTAELSGGPDEAYYRGVSRDLDLIIAGK
jgi:L-ribulose-5-phosphate 3-epimerase